MPTPQRRPAKERPRESAADTSRAFRRRPASFSSCMVEQSPAVAVRLKREHRASGARRTARAEQSRAVSHDGVGSTSTATRSGRRRVCARARRDQQNDHQTTTNTFGNRCRRPDERRRAGRRTIATLLSRQRRGTACRRAARISVPALRLKRGTVVSAATRWELVEDPGVQPCRLGAGPVRSCVQPPSTRRRQRPPAGRNDAPGWLAQG